MSISVLQCTQSELLENMVCQGWSRRTWVWSAQRPDLNPEHLWNELEHKIHARLLPPTTVLHLTLMSTNPRSHGLKSTGKPAQKIGGYYTSKGGLESGMACFQNVLKCPHTFGQIAYICVQMLYKNKLGFRHKWCKKKS